MLLWHGQPRLPRRPVRQRWRSTATATRPASASPRELAASGWTRDHEVVSGRDIALTLYPDRSGPVAESARRAAAASVSPGSTCAGSPSGSTNCPPGRCRSANRPCGSRSSTRCWRRPRTAHRAVRALRRRGCSPVLGEPYLAIGVELYDGPRRRPSSGAADDAAGRRGVPEGLAVSTVAMADGYDPVAMWMRANGQPFFDREAYGGGAAGARRGQPAEPWWRCFFLRGSGVAAVSAASISPSGGLPSDSRAVWKRGSGSPRPRSGGRVRAAA